MRPATTSPTASPRRWSLVATMVHCPAVQPRQRSRPKRSVVTLALARIAAVAHAWRREAEVHAWHTAALRIGKPPFECAPGRTLPPHRAALHPRPAFEGAYRNTAVVAGHHDEIVVDRQTRHLDPAQPIRRHQEHGPPQLQRRRRRRAQTATTRRSRHATRRAGHRRVRRERRVCLPHCSTPASTYGPA